MHELRLGPRLIKQFRRPAENQFQILDAFEAKGWPARISNPLPTDFHCDGVEQLHNAIKRLNHCQDAPLLRFRGDGTGCGISWQVVDRTL